MLTPEQIKDFVEIVLRPRKILVGDDGLLPHQETILYSAAPYLGMFGGVRSGKTRTGLTFLLANLAGPCLLGLPQNPDWETQWAVSQNFHMMRMIVDPLLESIPALFGEKAISIGHYHGEHFQNFDRRRDHTELIDKWHKRRIVTMSLQSPKVFKGQTVAGLFWDELGEMTQQEADLFNRMAERQLPTVFGTGYAKFLATSTVYGGSPSAVEFMDKATDPDRQWDPEAAAVANAENGRLWTTLGQIPSLHNSYEFPEGEQSISFVMRTRDMSSEQYAESVLGIPQRPTGAVFENYDKDKHLVDRGYTAGLPTYLWVDPGKDTYAVLVVQKDGDVWYAIDEMYIRDGTSERIISQAAQREWWRDVREVAIDGRQEADIPIWRSGAVWEKLGVKPPRVHPVTAGIQEGVQDIRDYLDEGFGGSHLFISKKCQNLDLELRTATWTPSGTTIRPPDHLIDALRYGFKKYGTRLQRTRPPAREAQGATVARLPDWVYNRGPRTA